MTQITLPDEYGWVVLSVGVIAVVQYSLGTVVMKHRKNFKSPEYLNKPEVKALQEEHKKHFGSSFNNLGYPDMGNGRYSQYLSYKQWVDFNNAQRGHQNMIEAHGPVVSCLLVAGLYQPKVAGIIGLAFAAGRVIYGFGYTTSSGADGRLAGAVVASLSTYALFGLTFYHGLRSLALF